MEKYPMQPESDQNFLNYKFLLLKYLSNWYWFIFSLLFFLAIAHFLNVRKPNVYELHSYISVRNEKNPYLKAGNSLFFNWGEGEKKANLIKTMLKLHSHNEKVVKQLKNYIKYQKTGPYYIVNLYHKTPFIFEMSPNSYQLINEPVHIKILDNQHFQLSVKPTKKTFTLYNYKNNDTKKIPAVFFQKNFKFEDKIGMPLLSGRIKRNKTQSFSTNDNYILRLENINHTTNYYQKSLYVKPLSKNSNILILKLKGSNKNELADYLNTTTEILKKQILLDKNQFAINTIHFIDSTLNIVKNELEVATERLKSFVNKKIILNIDDPTQQLFSQVYDIDSQLNKIQLKKIYYTQLLHYLQTNSDFEKIPAPSVMGISDPTIINKVNDITNISLEKKSLLQNYKIKTSVIDKINLKLSNLKKSLKETILSAIENLKIEKEFFLQKKQLLENQISKLPNDKQILLSIKKQYDLKMDIFNNLLKKRNEAEILKASNVSDIKIMEKAQDIGQTPIAPNRKINYFAAFVLGLLLPAVIIGLIYFFENKVYHISEVETITDYPVVGQIYHWHKKEPYNFVKFPNEVISESFRTIRTNLRFLVPKTDKDKDNTTILITSTMPDEGKTFVSTNLAQTLALSNEKTILLEFDLRKPNFLSIFTDLDMQKHKGISEFLCGTAKLAEIIVPSKIKNLDIIFSGGFPPNPSELILTGHSGKLFEELKKRYDYIIIDSPPLGLLNDANELIKYADLSLVIIRENFTYKSALKDLKLMANNSRHHIVYNDYKVNILNKYQYNKYNGYEAYFPQNKSKLKHFINYLKNKIIKRTL